MDVAIRDDFIARYKSAMTVGEMTETPRVGRREGDGDAEWRSHYRLGGSERDEKKPSRKSSSPKPKTPEEENDSKFDKQYAEYLSNTLNEPTW